jgi:hypothetical protein
MDALNPLQFCVTCLVSISRHVVVEGGNVALRLTPRLALYTLFIRGVP